MVDKEAPKTEEEGAALTDENNPDTEDAAADAEEADEEEAYESDDTEDIDDDEEEAVDEAEDIDDTDEEEADSDSPKTGDETPIVPFFITFIAALLSAVFIYRRRLEE